MADPEIKIFTYVGNELQSLVVGFAEKMASLLASELKVVGIAAVTLWVVYQGGLTILGKIDQPLSDFIYKSIKIIFICAFALNYGLYSTYVMTGFQGLENGLAQIASSAGGTPVHSDTSIYTVLDFGVVSGVKLAFAAQAKAPGALAALDPIGAAGWMLSGQIIGFSTVIFLLVCGAALIVNKILLSFIFALGPLFILCLLSPATAGFFDRWLGQVLNYILTIVFLVLISSLALHVFQKQVGTAASNISYASPFVFGLQFAVLACALSFIVFKISDLAAGLAGGASTAIASARQLMGGAKTMTKAVVGTAVAPVAAPVKGALALRQAVRSRIHGSIHRR